MNSVEPPHVAPGVFDQTGSPPDVALGNLPGELAGNASETPLGSPIENPSLGEYRGNGFVARLPKALRDQVNQMILDGVSYPEIIRRLGEPGKHLKPDHLSQWKKRGHKDWLIQQDWLAERRTRRESAADLVEDCDATQVNQGALHLGTLYVFDALRDL